MTDVATHPGQQAPSAPPAPIAGRVLWLLGPTSAGKTTLGRRVVEELRAAGTAAVLFDGDEVRDLFPASHGFDGASRLQVVRVLAHMANKAAEAGLHVVVAALTAGEDAREHIRREVRNLVLGYVSCSIETCAERDPKGLYRRAMAGEIDTLIGYNTDYEPPDCPDLVLDTDAETLDGLAARILARLGT